MSDTPRTVFIVDDDKLMRNLLTALTESVGLPARAFEDADAFLKAYEPGMRGCLILDVRMPGMSGLELQEHLQKAKVTLPTILITAHADVPMAVRAMRAGVFDFVEKPINEQQMLDGINRAMQEDLRVSRDEADTRDLAARLARLSDRERQVMELIADGFLNKQIAAKLGLSIKTVEKHRANLMRKMGAEGVAELVRMAIALDVV